MPEPEPRDAVAELLAPSFESIIAKGFNEDFPGGDECRVTHFPLDPRTLEVICRLNLPTVEIYRYDGDIEFTDEGVFLQTRFSVSRKEPDNHKESSCYIQVTVVQCKSYLSAIKAMRERLRGKYSWKTYGAPKTGTFGNYALESADGSTLLGVRFTTFFELSVEDDDYDECTCPWISIGRIAATLDKAMRDHEGSMSAVSTSTTEPCNLPDHFTVGEAQLLRFINRPTDCDPSFELEGENAYVVDDHSNIRRGSLDKELKVVFQMKGTAKLTVRTVNKSSLWLTEREFVLEA
ncbi:hypothetical protein B0T20DRAFT_78495 [Sordaria brevicollis]|uniref:Uncharacterized protein n=1 Tax=Sordaria brevicollis TaxID=83679 RepID=A0AAE0P113_SORBR|nr:hypothetical protein B0T20DRAFT_78495 [Sordaria brevicollis]